MFIEGDIHVELLARFTAASDRQRVMIEVGAAGPHVLSIGQPFRDLGWRVISIEPNPTFAAEHRAKGHEVHEVACSNFQADAHPFYVFHGNSTYWGHQLTDESYSSLGTPETFIDPHDSRVERITVKVTRLDDIVGDIFAIDLLVVDVEGSEIKVMEGLSINPEIVVLENLNSDPKYAEYMLARGYVKDGHNLHNEIYRWPRC